MNPLSLEQLTIPDADPIELTSIAAEVGCTHVSLFLRPGERPPQWCPLVTDAALRRTLRDHMAACGVTPYTGEFFPLSPRVDVASYRPAFACAAELGARRITALVSDTDEARRLDRFCELCDVTAEYGLGTNVEFVAITALPSLADAVRLVTGAAKRNAGIVVDALHLMRSGGSVTELAAIDPALIGGAHLCDGPRQMARERQQNEALRERMIPGTGDFPLHGFVAALPRHIPIGVEVPLASLADQGVRPRERARRAVEASRRIIAAAREM